MKTLLLIVGIAVLIACAATLLYAVLTLLSHHTLVDGTREHYAALRRKATVAFIVGAVLAAVGIACIVLRIKL